MKGEHEELGQQKVDEREQHKKSLGGYLGHVSTQIKNVKSCIEKSRDSKACEAVLKNFESAWNKYESCFESYLMLMNKNVKERERYFSKPKLNVPISRQS